MKKFLPLIIALLFLFSCSFKSDKEAREKANLPDIILINVLYSLGQTEENPVAVESERIEFYSSENLALTSEIHFIQYYDDGSVKIEGYATRSEIDTQNNVLHLIGDVKIHKVEGNVDIGGDDLYFDSENDLVYSVGFVLINSDDGLFAGTDFYGDLLTSNYTFKEIKLGKLGL